MLIAQLLLGTMTKFLVTAVRLSLLLPELVSATDNVHSGRLWHFPPSS
jgi:ribosomal protein S19